MDGKARYLFQILMAGQMVLLVTALNTYINLGYGPHYLGQWMRAFVISWPAASAASFIAVPVARWATRHITGLGSAAPR